MALAQPGAGTEAVKRNDDSGGVRIADRALLAKYNSPAAGPALAYRPRAQHGTAVGQSPRPMARALGTTWFVPAPSRLPSPNRSGAAPAACKKMDSRLQSRRHSHMVMQGITKMLHLRFGTAVVPANVHLSSPVCSTRLLLLASSRNSLVSGETSSSRAGRGPRVLRSALSCNTRLPSVLRKCHQITPSSHYVHRAIGVDVEVILTGPCVFCMDKITDEIYRVPSE